MPTIIAGIPMLLVLRQPDLGTALILGLIFATICLLTRIQWRSIATLIVSAGIALYPEDATTPDELLLAADAQMYACKRAARASGRTI